MSNISAARNQSSIESVIDMVQKDSKIKALNKMLTELISLSVPTWVVCDDGNLKPVHSEEYQKAFSFIMQEIEARTKLIMSLLQ